MLRLEENSEISFKKFIQMSGYKQRYLALRIGVSETLFSHQVAGRRKMARPHKRKLAKVMGARYKDVLRVSDFY